MITLIPVGGIDLTILGALGDRLEQIFAQPVRIDSGLALPKAAGDPLLQQYQSTYILAHLPKSVGKDRILGVADVDMYAIGYDFVFGEAELNNERRAIISVTRLRQEYYGKRRNQRLFEERMVKESVHELGHTWGLGHCPNPRCVMHFSTSVEETDYTSVDFCSKCGKRIEKKVTLPMRTITATR
jgi:archaemetzincin